MQTIFLERKINMMSVAELLEFKGRSNIDKERKRSYNGVRRVFCDRLKKILIDKELSVKELAEKLEYEERGLLQIVNNTKSPSLDLICKLCEFLEVSSDYLLGLKDN